MMYENLHKEMLDAIQIARENDLGFVVVTLQNAIGCIDMLQKDAAVLDLLGKALRSRDENSRIIGRSRGKVFKEDWER